MVIIYSDISKSRCRPLEGENTHGLKAKTVYLKLFDTDNLRRRRGCISHVGEVRNSCACVRARLPACLLATDCLVHLNERRWAVANPVVKYAGESPAYGFTSRARVSVFLSRRRFPPEGRHCACCFATRVKLFSFWTWPSTVAFLRRRECEKKLFCCLVAILCLSQGEMQRT